MTKKLMRIYKGKLSEVAAQIKREAKEDKIYNFHWLLDKMLAAGNNPNIKKITKFSCIEVKGPFAPLLEALFLASCYPL